MKNVHPLGEAHRVNGSIRVAPIISDDFQHTGTESLKRLRARVLLADLRKIKGVTYFVLNVLRTRSKRRQRVAEPDDRLR